MTVTNDVRGFTLIELIVVIAILAVLAGVAMPALTAVQAGANVQTTQATLDAHEIAVRAFAGDAVRRPTSAGELTANPGGLTSPRRWLGPYLTLQGTSASADAWGTPIRLVAPATGDLVELRSAGEDRALGNADDLTRTLSVAPELRTYSNWVAATVNTAIARYNAEAGDGRPPLSGNIANVVSQLKAKSLLNNSVDWTKDAYGRNLLTSGSPVSHAAPAGS